MRSRIEGTRIEDSLLGAGIKLGVAMVPSTGDVTLNWGMPRVIAIKTTAAINVKLPRLTADRIGAQFRIMPLKAGAGNAGTLTIQDAAGNALSPAASAPHGKFIDVFSADGTTWSASTTISS